MRIWISPLAARMVAGLDAGNEHGPVAIEIDPAQAWFWEQDWLAGEVEASQDVCAGDTRVFESSEAFLASLHVDDQAASD